MEERDLDFSETMKILITGGSGFLGRHLIDALSSTPDAEIHALSRTRGTAAAETVWHVADIRDAAAVDAAFDRIEPEWVFHLAADLRRGREAALLDELTDTNVEGTRNVLRAAECVPVAAFVAAGSYDEYGPIATPFREDGDSAPASPYGISKAAATNVILESAANGLPGVVIRFPVLYGKGANDTTLIGRLTHALSSEGTVPLASGEAARDFLHVSDAARALVAAARAIDRARGQVINVGTGTETKIIDVIRLAESITGREPLGTLGAIPERAGEQFSYVGTLEKAKALLNFEHRITLGEGLEELLAEFRRAEE